jgi:hypothetical protein
VDPDREALMYESDLTTFMRRFLEEHPEEIESQRKGRAVWWDKGAAQRVPAPALRHTPRAGGNEHTFEPAAGYGDDEGAEPRR